MFWFTQNFGQIQRVLAAALLNSNGKRELPFASDDDASSVQGKSTRNGAKMPRKTTDKSVPYLRDKLQKIITDRQGQ